ncbi:MAG TPA: hypothetical protein VJ878_02955 [Candidatus Izemoplasmatales bacterium]|nr:hypothetical protein [Candidatus Izemoplasmatales bacterium]
MQKQVIGIFGSIEPGLDLGDFSQTYAIVPDFSSIARSLKQPEYCLKKLLNHIF